MFRKVWIILLALIFMALIAVQVFAWDQKVVNVRNSTGANAADLHVTFTGTGGSLAVTPTSVIVVPDVAPVCGLPTVTYSGGNEVIITWPAACVDNGSWVTFTATTNNGPLGIASGFWTNAVGANIGAANPTFGIPSLTSYGFIILVLLLAATGIWFLTKKRLAHKMG